MLDSREVLFFMSFLLWLPLKILCWQLLHLPGLLKRTLNWSPFIFSTGKAGNHLQFLLRLGWLLFFFFFFLSNQLIFLAASSPSYPSLGLRWHLGGEGKKFFCLYWLVFRHSSSHCLWLLPMVCVDFVLNILVFWSSGPWCSIWNVLRHRTPSGVLLIIGFCLQLNPSPRLAKIKDDLRVPWCCCLSPTAPK